jgi:U3 small nucleolar RNA-associated protein 14
MRELVSWGEVKAKRVARIKSRTFQRIRRQGLGKVDVVDSDGEGEVEREVELAKERATLRHKNTGKSARGMKGREGVSRNERMAVEEMLERVEKLRRKMQGRDGSDEEGDGIGRIKERAFEELGALDRPDEDREASAERLGRGVFEMKFMKDAMARQQQHAGTIPSKRWEGIAMVMAMVIQSRSTRGVMCWFSALVGALCFSLVLW